MDIIDIPENFVDAEEPSDAQLMRNFASSIRVGPSQQMSGRVFFMGKDWPLQSALEAERADYLHQARSRWLGYRDAFRARKRAQERQLEAQSQFEASAAKGAHVTALREQLAKAKAIYESGCATATEIKQCKAEKDRISVDTATDLDAMQKVLAGLTDRLNVLEIRLQAQEAEYKQELENLATATGLAQREFHHRWWGVRQLLLQKVLGVIKKLISIRDDREGTEWIASNAWAVRNLDGVAGCAQGWTKIIWQQPPGLSLAEEVCERSDRFQRYLRGEIHNQHLASLGAP